MLPDSLFIIKCRLSVKPSVTEMSVFFWGGGLSCSTHVQYIKVLHLFEKNAVYYANKFMIEIGCNLQLPEFYLTLQQSTFSESKMCSTLLQFF